MSKSYDNDKLKEILLKLFGKKAAWAAFKDVIFDMAKEEQDKGMDVSLFHMVIGLIFEIETGKS